MVTKVYAGLLESAASENAARRRAMKAATDNAEDLIKILTRQANRARQDEITTEIMEIVGGAESLAAALGGMTMAETTKKDEQSHPEGRVVRVIGPVIDVEFPPAELPEIHTALTVDLTLEGETTTITCEVAQHIGDSIVRTIALKPDRRPRARHPREEHGVADHASRWARACSATSTT